MATLLLTAVGTAIGGPIGGAIGAFVGQQADRAIFGSGSREGPRLKELAVTTSSYGQPIPRNFGRLRVAGTVIWATDLAESSSSQGGKGQPKTTTYSYSANFAVALSSTPIAGVGRIWADGNLLRGASGDLKVEGTMRLYDGAGDAAIDPLIAADKGASAPAFRDTAYVVFEDLQLADYGNRIPALTFEIFAENDGEVSLSQLVPETVDTATDLVLSNTRGFADEGGSLGSTLSALSRVYPLTCATTASGLRLSSAVAVPQAPITLPEQLSPANSSDAKDRHKRRAGAVGQEPMALRYYDEERDYQPGVQRAIGSRPNGREAVIDLPATMTAAGAKTLANANAHRSRWYHETITWRIGELDPAIELGGIVKLPDASGLWRVTGWEWYDRGIELRLERLAPGVAVTGSGDAGAAVSAVDLVTTPTSLLAFETPADSSANRATPLLFAAVSSAGEAWKGASLYAVQGEALVPIGNAGSRRAITGHLTAALAPSNALVLDQAGQLELDIIPENLGFSETDVIGLSAGANRLLVGSEVLQFQRAEAVGGQGWKLTGLLRGRAGTEESAALSHPVGTPFALLDDRLTPLDADNISAIAATRMAAIGRGDSEAVFADVANSGLSRRLLVPVHPAIRKYPDRSWEFCWIRRARGQWQWDAQGEVPLVEESEEYLVGYGPTSSPFAAFSVTEQRLVLSESERNALVSQHGAATLWVRQVGTYSSSNALQLAQFT
ncbi:MAG: phage tail protein [Erythrobacter sp.]